MPEASTKKLKIAFVVPYFYPLKGGTESNALNMALQTAKLGHEVHVFTSDRRANIVLERKEEEYQGIQIHRLRRVLFRQYYLTFLPSLPSKLRKLRPDVIHTHIPGVLYNDIAVAYAKRKGTICINTPHDPFMSRGAEYSAIEKVMRAIFLPIFKLYYKHLYNYIIKVNPNQDEWIFREYAIKPEQLVYVGNGISPELFEQTTIDSQLKKQYEITDQIVITSIARYHEYKGYQNILAAIDKIKNKRQLNIKFFGIGNDSGMLPRLRNYIRDHNLEEYVVLLENPNDTVRDQLLELSQVFVLASRVEAFGIAMIEAMAKGNAIISTTTEGGKYLIKPENGFLYEFSEVDKLAELITHLASAPELRQKIINTNREYAKQFTWDQAYKPYAELLGKIQSGKAPKQ